MGPEGGVALHAAFIHGWLRKVSRSKELYTVRAASNADCEALAVARLRLQQLLEQESPSLWRMTPARKTALPDFYAQCIADADVQILVAEVRDSGTKRIVGTATGRLETGRDVARFGSIEDVWVEPEHRGHGICRALVSGLTDFFQTHGVQKLTVGFVHGGIAAGLWQRLGFTPTVVIANSDVNIVRTRSV